MSSQPKPAATESPAQGTIENVVNPKLWPEPSTIRNPELYKYTSLDTLKIQQSFRNYKRSAVYICRIWVILVKTFILNSGNSGRLFCGLSFSEQRH